MASSFWRFLDHIQRHIIVGQTGNLRRRAAAHVRLNTVLTNDQMDEDGMGWVCGTLWGEG